jgi:hypothetical protein
MTSVRITEVSNAPEFHQDTAQVTLNRVIFVELAGMVTALEISEQSVSIHLWPTHGMTFATVSAGSCDSGLYLHEASLEAM